MAVRPYLAMTSAEFSAFDAVSVPVCWMACQFSPGGKGLCNLPPSLPAGSLLMLNDQLPIWGHEKELILSQLLSTVDKKKCAGVLLDFQHPGAPELQELTDFLSTALPCPVAVTEAYAKEQSCPVFLSPCPHHTHLSEHMAPWTGRELWLDLAVDAETVLLRKDGAAFYPLPLGEIPPEGHWEKELHCHYAIENEKDVVRFTLWRTREDLDALAQEAEALGIQTMVGLYQELGVL